MKSFVSLWRLENDGLQVENRQYSLSLRSFCRRAAEICIYFIPIRNEYDTLWHSRLLERVFFNYIFDMVGLVSISAPIFSAELAHADFTEIFSQRIL